MLRQGNKYKKDRNKNATNIIENFTKQNDEEISSNFLLGRLVSQDPTKHHSRRSKIHKHHLDTITTDINQRRNSIQKAIDPLQEFEQSTFACYTNTLSIYLLYLYPSLIFFFFFFF
jgi:hypothetical protein